ncbi:MAG: homoserine dehydrogenase [Eubacteriales bacterium]|nr:homoserine dehydrogenase [Eubacteriales bacterium]
MNIAILGFGTVGSGIDTIIKENNISNLLIKKILVRDEKKLLLPNMTLNFDEIIEDKNINVVVECIGGIEKSLEYVKSALIHKKNVVTSNKMLIALYYEELQKLAKINNVQILFEASVGGGIPIIKNINQIKKIEEIICFKGIINGTTNYILYKMCNQNMSFSEALSEAKEKGYAELNPYQDISGEDIKYKTLILANIINEKSFSLNDIITYGIDNIDIRDIQFAKNNKKICKIISNGYFDRENASLYVIPEFIDENTILSNVKENYNMIMINTNTEGTLYFGGQGAGKLPTANAIIQDLLYFEKSNYNSDTNIQKGIINNDLKKETFYIRSKNVDILKNITKEKISEDTIITKEISIENMDKEIKKCEDEKIFVSKV